MEDKKPTRDMLPDNFATLDEFWGFWDTHSSADYEDAMEDLVQVTLVHLRQPAADLARFGASEAGCGGRPQDGIPASVS